jgi:gag-polypeptide of LTR copia-type
MGDVNEERTQVRSVIKRGGVSIKYPMLNDTNYGLWAVKIKIIMKALGVWEGVEGKGHIDKEKDQGALAAIAQTVPDTVMMAIAEKKTAKQAWETIKQMVVGEDRVRKARAQILKRQFDRMIMPDAMSIVEFSQKLIRKVGEIRSLGVEFKDIMVVERLFSVVPDKFLPIVGTIEQWGDTSFMTIAEAVWRLRMFEEGLKGRQQHKEEEEEKLLLTRAHGRHLP